MALLLPKLLERGDTVTIDRGVLKILPASGRPVPDEWITENRQRLCREVLDALGAYALEYVRYETGCYGKSKAGGVTLQFASIRDGLSAYVIFNADLTRSRNVADKKAGSPLPKGHFRVGKRSHFYKFWLASGLAIPRRLAAIHDYMGKLGDILFTGRADGERIDAGTLRPITISAAEIAAAFPDKRRTSARQAPDNSRTITPDKETAQSEKWRGLQPIPTTGLSSYGKTVIREDGYTVSPSPPLPTYKPPQEQSVDEWLDAYGST